MIKKLKFRGINGRIKKFDEYISKIESLVGNIKNVVIEATIEKIKIFEYENTILVLMKVNDGSDNITTLLIGNRDNNFKNIVKMLDVNNLYLIRGNVYINYAEIFKENLNLLNINISDKEFDLKKVLCISDIEVRVNN